MKYKTIVVDPPWIYHSWRKGSKKASFPTEKDRVRLLPYPSMTVNEIKSLDIQSIADENCELYLWTTQRYIPDAFEIIRAWGFVYKTTLVWTKNPMGTGQGGVYTPNIEFIIHARKGKMPNVTRQPSTWYNWKRTGVHSRKPQGFFDLIELTTEYPKIELFARTRQPGWDIWGNELENSIEVGKIASKEVIL